jgi:serine phosphatase RsbU (regulator of sigma subunit)
VNTRVDELLDENRWLREQLEAKAKVAARALAAQQRRVLEMEQTAAELTAVNDKLAAALRILEEKDRRISEDLAQAFSFQQRILPRLPPPAALAFAAVYRPAEVVGGDIYDVCGVAAGGHRVFVADAIGHGVQAALRTMILKTEYDRVRDAATPARALVELNRRIYETYPGLELQCTAACFDVRVEDGVARVAYATAAHPPLVHVTGGEARQLYQPSPFLGVLPAIELSPVHFEARRGDRFFLFSDGLVEECRGDEEFGIERVLAALARPGELARVTTDVVSELEGFASGEPLTDDLTIVAVEIA